MILNDGDKTRAQLDLFLPMIHEILESNRNAHRNQRRTSQQSLGQLPGR